MSASLEEFPSEKLWHSLSDIRLIILVVGLLEFFLFHLLTDTKRIHTLFWGIQSHLTSRVEDGRDSGAVAKVHIDVKQEMRFYDESMMNGGDIGVVLRSLGMPSDGSGGEGKSLDELSDLFEEEEVKEAFNVFDEDRDGFIDAEELQKVLCALGFSEGHRVENCRRMIRVFDEDGDGRIDFDEFVKFMEISLC